MRGGRPLGSDRLICVQEREGGLKGPPFLSGRSKGRAGLVFRVGAVCRVYLAPSRAPVLAIAFTPLTVGEGASLLLLRSQRAQGRARAREEEGRRVQMSTILSTTNISSSSSSSSPAIRQSGRLPSRSVRSLYAGPGSSPLGQPHQPVKGSVVNLRLCSGPGPDISGPGLGA